MLTARCLVFLTLPIAAPTVLAQCPPGPYGTTGKTQIDCTYRPDDSLRTWTITRPEVGRRLTEYPDIVFHPGESVLISAHGCVNVKREKGKHDDWRRYVDPEGNRTDRFFHGLVWIPGAQIPQDPQPLVTPVGTAPVPISNLSGPHEDPFNAEWLIIGPPPVGINPTLRLGYEADYEYPSDDPYPNAKATNRQCQGAGVATVIVMVKPGPPPTQPATRLTRTLLKFDPVSTQTDENGFMFSPQWFGNYVTSGVDGLDVADECSNFRYNHWLLVHHGIGATCTQQASFDVPPRLFTECLLAPGFGELHGHVNWAPATFVGKLRFQDISADGDVDLQLLTLGNLERTLRFPGNHDFGRVVPILTKDSQYNQEYRDALWLEFASYETTAQYFADHESWRALVDTKNKQRYQDRTAIVTGLLNLDCVHDCHTELHPVFAMAVRTKDETQLGINGDDPWMIFVRNAGNQGDCSTDEHYLNRDSYTFFLPAPPGATRHVPAVSNGNEIFHSNVSGLTWSLDYSSNPSENGIWVRFSFAPAACEDFLHKGKMVHISGVLRLSWDKETAPLSSPGGIPELFKTATAFDKTQEEKYWVSMTDRTIQTLSCASASDDVHIWNGEEELAKVHQSHHPTFSFQSIKSTVNDFLGGDLGLFPEVILYNKTSQIQLNPGVRYAPFQTSLFSVEFDAAPGLSRSVKSANGQNLSVRMSDWMGGFKVQFTHQLNMFAEFKGGQIYRSASSGFASTPDFGNFQGHDSFVLVGGGIQPGTQAQPRGIRVSVRVSVGYMYIPGTGEHMVRLTVGPQFQFPKKGH